MKKFLATFALVTAVMGVNAQSETIKDYVNYERGYRADIAVSTSISEQYSISTSHGFSFGNGLYVGGGVGFTAETFLNFEDAPHYLVPLFADVKYTFLNKRVSPFVSARVGGVFNTEYKMDRMLINPMVGINVRHFSVGLGYELQHAFKGVIESKASMHNVHLRVGYTF